MPGPEWTRLWPAGQAPLDLVDWDMTGPPPGPIDYVVLPYMDSAGRAHRLREAEGAVVAQTLSAGYESVMPHLPEGMTLCNARGVHDDSTAELALGLALGCLRGLGEAARDQSTETWEPTTRRSLADRRALVVGAGSIGVAIADRLVPFGVEVTLVASRAREEGGRHVHAVTELPDLLPVHDVVFLVLPLTEASRHLVDEEFLAALPDGAVLVNVARGAIVDTDALLRHLGRGRILAGLDVTDPEPLPAGHPLWHAPGALITPHVGGNTTAFPSRAMRLLRSQLGAFANGEPLANVVAGPGVPTSR